MVNLVQDVVTNFFKKSVRCMSISIPLGHESKISRHSASFMINKTQSKFKATDF